LKDYEGPMFAVLKRQSYQ